MPSDVINRKTVREALAAAIDARFGSTWDVYSYKVKQFTGKARNIVVSSAGAGRTIMGADADESDSSFRFRVFVLVQYENIAEGWTEQESEDELDLAEKTITDFCNDNQEGTYWNRLYLEGMSDADMVEDLGGQVFRREIMVIRAEKYT